MVVRVSRHKNFQGQRDRQVLDTKDKHHSDLSLRLGLRNESFYNWSFSASGNAEMASFLQKRASSSQSLVAYTQIVDEFHKARREPKIRGNYTGRNLALWRIEGLYECCFWPNPCPRWARWGANLIRKKYLRNGCTRLQAQLLTFSKMEHRRVSWTWSQGFHRTRPHSFSAIRPVESKPNWIPVGWKQKATCVKCLRTPCVTKTLRKYSNSRPTFNASAVLQIITMTSQRYMAEFRST